MFDVFARVVRLKRLGLPLLAMVALPVPTLLAQAQVDTPLRRQLQRFDLGLSAIDVDTGSTSGTSYATSTTPQIGAQFFKQEPNNTVGGLFQIRWTRSPLVGAEFNFNYAKYTTNYSLASLAAGVQQSVSEYTLGYVAHGPRLTGFNLQPFASAGIGTTAFKPTEFGGQGLREQARMTYYYSGGLDAPVLLEGHLGLRLQFRQAFFLAPDYGQNYLTTKQRTSAIEPGIGIYLHF